MISFLCGSHTYFFIAAYIYGFQSSYCPNFCNGHSSAGVILPGVFVVVFLDGPGTVAGHVKSILSENILTLIF